MAQTKSKSTAKNLLAGGTAGAIEACIMYPTEFVKTQLQLTSKPNLSSSSTAAAPFSTPWGCLTYTARNKGILALYSGLSTLVTGSIPKAAVRFGAFNFVSQRLRNSDGTLSSTSTMISGLSAGITEAIAAVTPMETIKTKLIHDQNSSNPRFRGMIHGVSTIVREEGIAGVYKGVVPTMLKQGTNQMVRFAIYGRIKEYITGGSTTNIALWQSLLSGSLAGFVSVYFTMPFDVVKTRMQSLQASMYSGTADCLLKIVRNEGVLTLWKGTVPRLSRVCFSGGIIFASYEAIMEGLNLIWKESDA